MKGPLENNLGPNFASVTKNGFIYGIALLSHRLYLRNCHNISRSWELKSRKTRLIVSNIYE